MSVSNYAMVNLIAGRVVVPELIQDDFTPARVCEETLRVLDEGRARTEMLESLREVREKLGKGGATRHAAREVSAFLAQ